MVTTIKLGGFRTAIQRFPLTEPGWADAWQVLSRLDTSAAEAIGTRLARIETGRRAADARAALDDQSLCTLRNVVLDGGSRNGLLAKGHYDLRLQDDKIMVCPAGSAHAVAEWPYADVEAVEVSPSAGQPASVPLGLISGFGLLGALTGFLFLGRLGIVIGALVLGLVGGLVAAGMYGTDTIVRVQRRDAEWQFRSPERPDDVRRALSEPLTAIRQASGARANRPEGHAEPPPDSVADELAKVASLLQQDLLTRDEFELVKAKLIAEL